MDTAFRKIDIDQYDEDILHESELYDADPRDPSQVLEEAKQRQASDITLQTLLTILNTTKSTEIPTVIKSLSQDTQDTLMKYLYKGMAMPGWGDISGSVLLGWHEKLTEIAGTGSYQFYFETQFQNMVMSLLYHAARFAYFAFSIYATFKALSHRPLSETDLQRWSMYWVTIGLFVAFEYMAEWLICWLPFYWELKLVFLLFLCLPQTEGSTYIYTTYIQPFFVQHETDLDAGMISVQRNILAFFRARFITLWEFAWNSINKVSSSGQPAPGARGPTQVPALSLDSMAALWKTYSPLLPATLRPAPTSQPSASSTSSKMPTENGRSQNLNASTSSFSSSSPSLPEPQKN
ncbi:hypothetical protein DXG01_011867 [Tephrocybe rancida]|nr:hypothetical protein DXG01_011867 [Tephrocybe rancida]